MTDMEQGHDVMVLHYILRLAQSEADPTLKSIHLERIEKAKMLVQRDLMQAEIDRLKSPKLQSVEEANEG